MYVLEIYRLLAEGFREASMRLHGDPRADWASGRLWHLGTLEFLRQIVNPDPSASDVSEMPPLPSLGETLLERHRKQQLVSKISLKRVHDNI